MKHGEELHYAGDEEEVEEQCPVLVVSMECVFTKPAKNFWSKVADETGTELHIIIAEDDELTAQKYNISGFPCLVCGPDKKYYGIHFSHAEGKAILTGDKQLEK